MVESHFGRLSKSGQERREQGRVMTTQLAITPRDRFLQAAEKEMIDFQRREIAFRRKDRQERAAELRLPIEKHEIH
jgi:hypothetical protein